MSSNNSEDDYAFEEHHQSDEELQQAWYNDDEIDFYKEEDHVNDEEQTVDPEHQSQQSPTSPPSKSKPKKQGVKGKKTFGLPLDRASFETFIDDDTTVDEQGYPILPNRNTVYVRQPGQPKLTNWGTFAFTYTTSSGGTKNNTATWRTVRFQCLGVIVCTNSDCDYLGSPPTAKDKRLEFQSEWVWMLLCVKSYKVLTDLFIIFF